jgi:hypothetical protein
VRGHDGPRDGQPEPAPRPLGLLAATIEGLEDLLALRGWDPRAFVGHADADRLALTRDVDTDGAARRRVPRRVLDEVGQHLVELHRVGGDLGELLGDLQLDPHVVELVAHPGEHGLGHLLDVGRHPPRDEGARTDPREIEDVADQPVQAVGLLEDGHQEFTLLGGVVHGRHVEQARDPRLDRRERRPEVVGDRGEHRRAQLVGLGVQLGQAGAGIQPGAVQGDRSLARRRLEQLLLASRERPRTRGPLRRQRSQGNRRHHDGQDLARPPELDVLAPGDRAHLVAVEHYVDAAHSQPERVDQQPDELVEHAVWHVAGQQLARQQGQQTGLPLALGRAPALGRGVADDQTDHRRDGEEHDGGDHVAELLELEPLRRLLDPRQHHRGQQRRDDAGPDPAADRRYRDGKHEDRDPGSGTKIPGQDHQDRAADRRAESDREGADGDLIHPGVLAIRGHDGHATASFRPIRVPIRHVAVHGFFTPRSASFTPRLRPRPDP